MAVTATTWCTPCVSEWHGHNNANMPSHIDLFFIFATQLLTMQSASRSHSPLHWLFFFLQVDCFIKIPFSLYHKTHASNDNLETTLSPSTTAHLLGWLFYSPDTILFILGWWCTNNITIHSEWCKIVFIHFAMPTHSASRSHTPCIDCSFFLATGWLLSTASDLDSAAILEKISHHLVLIPYWQIIQLTGTRPMGGGIMRV